MALTRLPSFTLDSTSNFTFANVTVTSNVAAANANLGNTVTANYFVGNGSSLTGVNAATLNGFASTSFATSAQGAKADTAVQPASLASYATQTDINNAVANLVSSAPAALDTLRELANALGNDASYSTTINNALANKLSTSNFSSTANTWISTQTTSNLSEGSNQYYTVARANSAIDARVTTAFVNNLAITSLGTLSSVTVTGNANVGSLNATDIVATGNLTTGNLITGAGSGGNITGANRIVANYFIGSGNGLSNITGANVTGAVAYATTANSVAGANVIGAVTYASTANNVSGANVTGEVANATYATTAGTAYSVSGANVTGTVANATYATTAGTANSVAVANVVGIGNIATINKDGNASNILYGNGVFASAPITYGNSNVAAYLPTYTGNLSPGNISIAPANLKISGGTANYVLKTDGAGNLSWTAQTGGTGGGGASALVDLTDVTITSPANGDILSYDSANSKWINIVNSGGGGGGSSFLAKLDTFTGDGSNTSFTLSGTPAGPEYTLVTIGGVSQPRTSFSLAANVITFSSPPPSQTIVEVTILGGSAAAMGTATTVTSGYQPNIISVGTLNSLAVSGNVTANKFYGNLVGAATSATTAGTVTTNAQPNITSVGTLSNLTVTGNVTSSTGKFTGDGSGLSNVSSAQYVTASNQPNITSVGTLTTLNIAGAFSSSSFSEPITVINNAVSTVAHNFTLSSTFIHLTPAGNFTANFTNVPTTDNRIVVIALIIYQGSSAYIPNSIQIDGFGYTPKWVNGVAPAGTPNKVDIFSYSLVRYNGGWDIYGQISTYGVV